MTLSITKGWSDSSTLTEAQIDTALDDIETYFNTTKLTASDIADGAVTDDNVAAKAITQPKIADDALDAAKPISGSIEGSKVADGAVDVDHYTQLDEDDAVIDIDRRAEANTVGASTFATFTVVESNSVTPIGTKVEVTVPTSGTRPVGLFLVASNNKDTSLATSTIVTGDEVRVVQLDDDGNETLVASVEPDANTIPPGLLCIDLSPVAGSTKYALQGSGGAEVRQSLFVAIEF